MEVLDPNQPQDQQQQYYQQAPPPQQPPVGEKPKFPPKTWLVESILVTFFCCIPFGIVGIVYAAKVESLFYAGRQEEAERASYDAGKWTKIGFWVGLSLIVLYVLSYAVMLILGLSASLFNL